MPNDMSETGKQSKQAEQRRYPDEENLTEKQVRDEGSNLIEGFFGVFGENPRVREVVVNEYFRIEHGGGSIRDGAVCFKAGTGIYTLNTIVGGPEYCNLRDGFTLIRKEGEVLESLEVTRAVPGRKTGISIPTDERSLIRYTISLSGSLSSSENRLLSNSPQGEHKHTNNGIAVDRAEELLKKTQRDFGKKVFDPASISH